MEQDKETKKVSVNIVIPVMTVICVIVVLITAFTFMSFMDERANNAPAVERSAQ